MSDLSLPGPLNLGELKRVTHTRLRRRILYDDWRNDLNDRVEKQIGTVRREAWGEPDLSANVFLDACSGQAVLYDRDPVVSCDEAAGALTIAEVQASGFWALQRRTQRDAIGLREMFVRAGTDAQGRLVHRPVFPDMVEVEADSDRPDEPVRVVELRERVHPGTGECLWTRDVIDIRSLEYRVLDAAGRVDMSDLFLDGARTGDAFPFRMADDTPVMPYVAYHAQKTGQMFDWSTGTSLVEGTLNVGELWTMFGHVVRNASWPQRWAVNVQPAGNWTDENRDGKGRSEMVTDQAAVALLRAIEDITGQPMIGQWAPGCDPKVLQEAISAYELRVASHAGPGVNFQRLSGDPRSGYALGIDRSAQREAQRAFEPTFREADEKLLAVSAVLLNRARNLGLPESGYRVTYTAIPDSPEEMQAKRQHILELIDAGLIDRVTAYQQLHPGTPRAEAERALNDIAAVNARFRAA
jgi:hypothetical protein